ncbi:sialidase family protein [Microbacterium elymi]|uniref:Glycoside hydrolase n=1 Tax=Microbacterium elymi TaxID=2909587 RepID=A0ABY5NMQ7_9MICO|nr:sialidase family protein [Microbacterium elymi]UUT36463.1 glycoside hydrolase [Microbacterium elymi]
MAIQYRRPQPASQLEHDVVYRDEAQFCAWPYTMGFWEVGSSELVANFMSLDADYSDPSGISHDRLGERFGAGSRMVTVRSTDRGRTWGKPEFDVYPRVSPDDDFPADLSAWGPFDFTRPDVLIGNVSTQFGKPESRAYVRVSQDAGRSWTPSARLPLDGLHSLSAINSALVRPDGRALLFLTLVSEDGWNRRPLVYASTDDGTDFHFLSFITPEHDPFAAADGDWKSTYRFGGHRWFYPRGVLLPDGRIVCTLREPARPHRGDVDRGVRERRRGPHLVLPVPRQRLRRARQPHRAVGRTAGRGLRLSHQALRHPCRGQRGRWTHVGPRTDRAR